MNSSIVGVSDRSESLLTSAVPLRTYYIYDVEMINSLLYLIPQPCSCFEILLGMGLSNIEKLGWAWVQG